MMVSPEFEAAHRMAHEVAHRNAFTDSAVFVCGDHIEMPPALLEALARRDHGRHQEHAPHAIAIRLCDGGSYCFTEQEGACGTGEPFGTPSPRDACDVCGAVHPQGPWHPMRMVWRHWAIDGDLCTDCAYDLDVRRARAVGVDPLPPRRHRRTA